MSDYQFSVYEKARVIERRIEKNNAKKRAKAAKKGTGEIYEDASSTYRIFSRAFCNFVFPVEIGRPLPRDGGELSTVITETAKEDLLDAISIEEKINKARDEDNQEEIVELSSATNINANKSYEERTREAL